jgi:hypothetical protein
MICSEKKIMELDIIVTSGKTMQVTLSILHLAGTACHILP